MKAVILIPTYNEIDNIEKLLNELLRRSKAIKKHELKILIVDDNSPDGTAEVVKKYRSKFKKRILLLTGKKEGLGKAMVRGYLYSMNKLGADVVIANEADFAFSFKHLAFMLAKIEEGYDVVVASRHVGIGKTKGWTWNRKLNHWVANTLFASIIAGVSEVYDHNGAYRAIRTKGVLDSIDLDSMRVSGFGFFFYCLYKLTTVTDKIYEFPATYRFREAGESKISFNPKYIRTYMRDVLEYIKLAFIVRMEKLHKIS